jgi:hypothetical protein
VIAMASNLMQLLDEKIKINNWLSNVLYGSIELRTRKSKQYIYVHFRNGDKVITKYAGEYSSRLVNIIHENTLLAKELKKRLRAVNKQLKKLNYVEKELSSSSKSSLKFVKFNLINIIYNQLAFECLNSSYLEVQSLIEDNIIRDLDFETANKINNLKKAWEFILNKDVINTGVSFSLLSQINSLLESGFSYNAGKVRRIQLQLDNTNYIPPVPFEENIDADLNAIIKTKDKPFDKTLNIFIYLLKSFVFTNSNLNTTLVFVNYYLIKNGLGLIYIPSVLKETFEKSLLELYEWNDDSQLRKFVTEFCYVEK